MSEKKLAGNQNPEVSTDVSARARGACVERINELTAAIKRGVFAIQDVAVEIGNNAIQLGLFLQEATGHTQLEMPLFRNLMGVSEDLSFWLAQRCVSLANRKGAKFKFQTFAEVQPELNILFQGMNLIEPAARHRTIGEPLQKNWGLWIPQAFTPINTGLQELMAAEPMERWSRERLETFAAQSQFVHDEHERAQEMLTTNGHANEYRP